MSEDLEWSEGQYGPYAWHDNRIRGLRFRSPVEGYDCDFILEIDHITQWLREGNAYTFTVAPALLIFHNMDHLKVNLALTYKQDLDINAIGRKDIATEAERRHGILKYRWSIYCHSFTKEQAIEFTASSFTLKLLAEPTLQETQRLEDPEL